MPALQVTIKHPQYYMILKFLRPLVVQAVTQLQAKSINCQIKTHQNFFFLFQKCFMELFCDIVSKGNTCTMYVLFSIIFFQTRFHRK